MKKQVEQYIQQYLEPAIEKNYGIIIQQMQYFFPYDSIPKGSRIIIYGAGNVGKSYQNCLRSCQYAIVVGWVDKEFEKIQKQGYVEVENPNNIFDKEFEYVLIAIEKEKVALQIKQDLIDKGICKEKIIWIEPKKFKVLY